MQRRWTSWFWLVPGLACWAAMVPTAFFALLVMSDEAHASMPIQLAALGLGLAGALLLSAGIARVVWTYGRTSREPTKSV